MRMVGTNHYYCPHSFGLFEHSDITMIDQVVSYPDIFEACLAHELASYDSNLPELKVVLVDHSTPSSSFYTSNIMCVPPSLDAITLDEAVLASDYEFKVSFTTPTGETSSLLSSTHSYGMFELNVDNYAADLSEDPSSLFITFQLGLDYVSSTGTSQTKAYYLSANRDPQTVLKDQGKVAGSFNSACALIYYGASCSSNNNEIRCTTSSSKYYNPSDLLSVPTSYSNCMQVYA